jgi:hypothetical protein
MANLSPFPGFTGFGFEVVFISGGKRPGETNSSVLATLDGEPLSGATVEISDYVGKQIAKSITDSDGGFEILTDAAAGEYELVVSNSGHLNDEQV